MPTKIQSVTIISSILLPLLKERLVRLWLSGIRQVTLRGRRTAASAARDWYSAWQLYEAAERFDSPLHDAAERFDSPLHHAVGSQTLIVMTPRI